MEFNRRMDKVFEGVVGKGGGKVVFNDKCQLDGLWKAPHIHSMAMQACELGIPSI
jgi:hypothetical protein